MKDYIFLTIVHIVNVFRTVHCTVYIYYMLFFVVSSGVLRTMLMYSLAGYRWTKYFILQPAIIIGFHWVRKNIEIYSSTESLSRNATRIYKTHPLATHIYRWVLLDKRKQNVLILYEPFPALSLHVKHNIFIIAVSTCLLVARSARISEITTRQTRSVQPWFFVCSGDRSF